MVTGRQIRKACHLVGMTTATLARFAGVGYATLLAVRNTDDEPNVSLLAKRQIRAVLEERGVEFFTAPDGSPDARLRGKAP